MMNPLLPLIHIFLILPLNDTSFYNTINKTPDTNPSHTRIRHPGDSSSLPSSDDTSQSRHLKSHFRLSQQPRKDFRLFLSPSKILNQNSLITFRNFQPVTPHQVQL